MMPPWEAIQGLALIISLSAICLALSNIAVAIDRHDCPAVEVAP